MTALCGGGTSSPKAGVAEAIVYGAGAIATLLEKRGNIWAAALAPLLGVLSYDAITLCSSDPPAIPTFSAADANAVLKLNDFNAFTAAVSKFSDLIANNLWFDICQCNAGAQPAPTAPVAPPAGLPNTTTIVGYGGPVLACDHFAGLTCHPTDTLDCSIIGTRCSSGPCNPHPIPAGATSLTVTGTVIPGGGTHGPENFDLWWYDSPTHESSGVNVVVTVPSGSTASGSIAVPAGTYGYVLLGSRPTFPAPSDSVTAVVDAFCGGSGGTLTSPCCPADQFSTGMLTQILQMVTLLQRQISPFAYISSTAHSGLTGHGSFSVQGLIGVAIALTAIPSSAGAEVGTPTAIFDAGRIDVGTADGYRETQQIESAAQLWFPQSMGAMTLVSYSLNAGVTATITELVREA